MRVPSIHITKTTLEEYLENNGDITLETLNKFMKFARGKSVPGRCLINNSKKHAEKLDKLSASNIGDANLLSDIIYSVRVKLKHIGVSRIKQTDPQWANLKELANIINQFCESQDLASREGYIEYVSIGLSLMQSTSNPRYAFCAKWMIQRADWIISTYEGKKQIKNDSHPERTIELHNIYVAELANRTGIYNKFLKDPAQYLHFMKSRCLADEIGINYTDFILAQFYALEFCNGIPSPKDLSGDKARERVIKYVSYKGINLQKANTQVVVDWNKFKEVSE